MDCKQGIFPEIKEKIKEFNLRKIPEQRQAILIPLIEYVIYSIEQRQEVQLNFICTHNSRRSQLSQVWAQIMACYFNLPVRTFSGGVEVTAFNENAVNALRTDGLKISGDTSENPHFEVNFSTNGEPLFMYSKLFDAPGNPKSNFAAVITCAHANENCPFIPGAEKRIPLEYEDPKAFDGRSLQEEKYLERSRQIATEMFYVFSAVSQNLKKSI